MGLVEQLALAGHPGNRLQAQRSHGNKQQYDQQERTEKFRVDGGLEPATQRTSSPSGERVRRRCVIFPLRPGVDAAADI